ncbi:zinc finger CCCH domain-containing protein 15-like [Corticium candelabrum]|uniref:zinc finger CCCH domain-containing protein 15-like n=1 Tax=Corticium candelabrum TaxID=121492 RepID=UPI002E26E312|nr:zinc finger CCCH domain-containing protein 15-like [Corticium candelabrum]
MPPKKKQEVSKKTEQKKKEKIIEDKTFGLKNKKGKKQQQFIKNVTHQVQHGASKGIAKLEQEKHDAKGKKKDDDLGAIFKPLQSVSKGADPKSVLCVFFKQGQCTKGDKCKFSHDLALERKGEKKSIYADSRGDDDLKDDNMDTWDQAKLEDVVQKKHGSEQANRTEIVCKYFLEAVEKGLYGWFWVCPNGGDKCLYRHCLPPGFILKKDKKAMEEQKERISIEELIESERAKLGVNLTPVTLESFLEWKKRKVDEKRATAAKNLAKKKDEFKQGKMLGVTGREVFMFNPELVKEDDDEDGGDVVVLTKQDSDEDSDEEGSTSSSTPALDLTDLGAIAETATPLLNAQITRKQTNPLPTSKTREPARLSDTACALDSDEGIAAAAAAAVTVNGVEIDETLFQCEALGELGLEDSDLEDSDEEEEQQLYENNIGKDDDDDDDND